MIVFNNMISSTSPRRLLLAIIVLIVLFWTGYRYVLYEYSVDDLSQVKFRTNRVTGSMQWLSCKGWTDLNKPKNATYNDIQIAIREDKEKNPCVSSDSH